MGKIHLPAKTDDRGNVEENELSCPRCGNSESSFGFASDGDKRCCKRCQMFFTTRNGDPAGKGLNRDTGPAISER